MGTVRADFVSRVATVPGIGDEINRGLYLLRPMGPDKLREAVTGPAQLKGVLFESDEMVDSLVASTAESDAGLPLFAVCARGSCGTFVKAAGSPPKHRNRSVVSWVRWLGTPIT